MLRIGIVGGTEHPHARSFAAIFNGFDQKRAECNQWKLPTARIPGVQVTHVWDEDREKAALLAKTCHVEHVTGKMQDMIGQIDAVMIPDDCSMKHQRKAELFLKEGLPTFIDKPLSDDIMEAERIVETARKYGAPMMSCSGLRYAKEVEAVQKEKHQFGDILTGFTTCHHKLLFYGIHAFEQLYTLVGPGIKSVRNVGRQNEEMVIVRYKDGRQFVLLVYLGISPLFQMSIYGTKGWKEVLVEDGEYFMLNMLRHFVGMVTTGKMPFPPEETLEIVKVLCLAEKSRETGEEIEL